MRVIGGLQALRSFFINGLIDKTRKTCRVTGIESAEDLKPAIVTVMRLDGTEVIIEGPCSSKVKARMKVPSGIVRSIKRAHVECNFEVVETPRAINVIPRCVV